MPLFAVIGNRLSMSFSRVRGGSEAAPSGPGAAAGRARLLGWRERPRVGLPAGADPPGRCPPEPRRRRFEEADRQAIGSRVNPVVEARDFLNRLEHGLSEIAVPMGTRHPKRIEDHALVLSRREGLEIDIEKSKNEYLKNSAFILHDIIDFTERLLEKRIKKKIH